MVFHKNIMIKLKLVLLFIFLKYHQILLAIQNILEDILAIISSAENVKHTSRWCYPCCPWHTKSLLEFISPVKKIEPSPF